MMTGNVFDIRRFSTHDGSGIRTTVFLKGCPMRCLWCQNPEGIAFGQGPAYFPKKCIHCGTCLRHAARGAVYEKDGEICIRREREADWETVADACPSGAIMMDSSAYEPEELVEEVLKDEVFFRNGGGVTLSGGEPLAQPEFTIKVLELLQERGIHTAIETALHVPGKWVEKALPHLDLIYADMKLEREEKHREYTGVSGAQIKENLRYILTSPYRDRAVIRTPLIPGYTAVEENLRGIASFLSSIYPEVKYELLNYNPLAQAKYPLSGREYCFKENPKLYTKAQMEAFGNIVTENGIKHLIMEI